MARAIVSDLAFEDMIEIWEYIADDSERAADRTIDEISAAIVKLSEDPGLGVVRSDLGVTLRSFPVKTYLVFYRETDEGIEVARVLSGYRDLAKLL
jgi:toxin ParE1/3/4